MGDWTQCFVNFVQFNLKTPPQQPVRRVESVFYSPTKWHSNDQPIDTPYQQMTNHCSTAMARPSQGRTFKAAADENLVFPFVKFLLLVNVMSETLSAEFWWLLLDWLSRGCSVGGWVINKNACRQHLWWNNYKVLRIPITININSKWYLKYLKE